MNFFLTFKFVVLNLFHGHLEDHVMQVMAVIFISFVVFLIEPITRGLSHRGPPQEDLIFLEPFIHLFWIFLEEANGESLSLVIPSSEMKVP